MTQEDLIRFLSALQVMTTVSPITPMVGDSHGCKSVASGGMSPIVMKLLRFHIQNKIHINPI